MPCPIVVAVIVAITHRWFSGYIISSRSAVLFYVYVTRSSSFSLYSLLLALLVLSQTRRARLTVLLKHTMCLVRAVRARSASGSFGLPFSLLPLSFTLIR
ncbi:hypothetical protein NUW54_g4460 [Trametes sanguinea]|uniref:Uncharacterized protein n=1 Tax=Trametes sanguinea TaxID=158606 RepID=A0ACC1PYF0_9APHY|nr:hypothetical protein NUW54_g4460 [Trametes sanguinea]